MSEESRSGSLPKERPALAMIHLTRRDDLTVVKADQGLGLEFIVVVATEGGEPSLRQFGVALRGTIDRVTVAHLDEVLRQAMQSFRGVGAFPYPVCLFHFTMDDDKGHYTWVAEPAVTGGGPAAHAPDASLPDAGPSGPRRDRRPGGPLVRRLLQPDRRGGFVNAGRPADPSRRSGVETLHHKLKEKEKRTS